MSLRDLISEKYPLMSKTQQKIARFINSNYPQLVFIPAAELAKHSQTSPASVVRFAASLGFDGYIDMQKHIQKEAMTSEGGGAAQTEFDGHDVKQFCDSLLNAGNVLIVGYMNAFGTAAELLHRLSCVRDKVFFARLIGDFNDALKLMEDETMILAVSFAPHYVYTHYWVKEAKDRGCPVTLITDSYLTPFASLADKSLVFPLDEGPDIMFPDLSPVSRFIQAATNYIYQNRKSDILDWKRLGEPFIE